MTGAMNVLHIIVVIILGVSLVGSAEGVPEDVDYRAKRHLLQQLRGEGYRDLFEYDAFTTHMNELLFPNRSSKASPSIQDTSVRGVQRIKQMPGEYEKRNLQESDYQCIVCRDMEYCSALNGLLIEEIYLPDNPEDMGTCRVIDELGRQVSIEVFGNGRSFRDTPQCRDIVMQYLCLFYGSDNKMYTNNCINQEDVSDSNPVNHKVAPRPPCRSFCVQVAEVCANDPKFMQLCSSIDCPPMEDSCTPDPMIEGQVLAANIGCDMPYSINPYFKPSSAPRAHHGTSAFMTSVIVSLLTASLLLRRN
jgi:hypothetical protein